MNNYKLDPIIDNILDECTTLRGGGVVIRGRVERDFKHFLDYMYLSENETIDDSEETMHRIAYAFLKYYKVKFID